jgi:ribosome-binding ATPase
VLAVVNVGEDDIDRSPRSEALVAAEFNDAGDNVEVIGMCVQLEAEAAAIEDPVERAEMLEGFGLGEGALFRMVRSAYHLLGLRTYFTTGEKESRAWTFYEGSTAPVCAGRIHTDFQRGFIKAEVIQWDELLEARLVARRQGGRQDPRRGQGLRRPGRRRDGVPLQRLTWRPSVTPLA